MARVTIEDCLEVVENRFALSIAAMKRSKQIAEGSLPLSEETENQPIVLALREIAEGKIKVIYPPSPEQK